MARDQWADSGLIIDQRGIEHGAECAERQTRESKSPISSTPNHPFRGIAT
jgi:hypothetical protein